MLENFFAFKKLFKKDASNMNKILFPSKKVCLRVFLQVFWFLRSNMSVWLITGKLQHYFC
jgi:preprotein translocase subunit SecE